MSPPPDAQRNARDRKTLLYFSGLINENEDENNVRALVYRQSLTQSDDEVVINGKTNAYRAHMLTSTFFLAPPGVIGGWGRRTALAVQHGCIPMFVQDNTGAALEELLPWDEFSISVAQADIPRLHEILVGVKKDEPRVARMQRALAQVAPLLSWTKREGRDGIAAVVEIFRRRLKNPPRFETSDPKTRHDAMRSRQAKVEQLSEFRNP
jgi:hypothetical protein